MNYQKTAFNLIETSFISIHIMRLSRACVLPPAAAGAAKGTKRSLIWDDSRAFGHRASIVNFDFFLIIKQQQQKKNTRNKTYNVWKIREFCQFPSVLTL